eukprot:g7105.t1
MVTFPSKLKTLKFGNAWNRSLERVNFPESLEKLIFGSDFNQSLTVAKLPENLQLLAVSDAFDQCFGDALPVNLKELEFRFRSIWNHPLDDMSLGTTGGRNLGSH